MVLLTCPSLPRYPELTAAHEISCAKRGKHGQDRSLVAKVAITHLTRLTEAA